MVDEDGGRRWFRRDFPSGFEIRRCGQDDKKIRLLIEGGIQWRVNIFLLGIEWAGGLRGAWALVAWWVECGKVRAVQWLR